jgi:hypothetical protein
MTDDDLVRLLLDSADSAENKSATTSAGIVRIGARRIVELSDENEVLRERVQAITTPDGCARCGGPIVQSGIGRPKRWCSERCRDAARKSRNVNMAVADRGGL